MFNPSREQARRFFIDAWRKRRDALPATPLEILVADVIALHPEYHALIEAGENALEREWTPESGETNPFLHLSLHVAIAEQLSIDQPLGIRTLYQQLTVKYDQPHDALHDILDCLGEAIFTATRDQTPPDNNAYIDCIRRRL